MPRPLAALTTSGAQAAGGKQLPSLRTLPVSIDFGDKYGPTLGNSEDCPHCH